MLRSQVRYLGVSGEMNLRPRPSDGQAREGKKARKGWLCNDVAADTVVKHERGRKSMGF